MGSKAKALLVDVAQGEATNELIVVLNYTLEAGEQRLLGLQFFVGHTWMAFQVHKQRGLVVLSTWHISCIAIFLADQPGIRAWSYPAPDHLGIAPGT